MNQHSVYFIQADENGPIKIGVTSDDPRKRLSQLQTGNAASLKLLGSIKGTLARERKIHDELAEWRLQGEWFEPHPTVLATIGEALAFPPELEHCGGPHCSFCGICRHEAFVLIAGMDDAFICAECVGRCAKIAAEHYLKAASGVLAQSVIQETGGVR